MLKKYFIGRLPQNDIFSYFVIYSNLQDNYIGEINMRYSMDSYEEINEEQVQKFFSVIKEILLELKDGNKKGRKFSDFIKSGVTKETMSILKASKFITWHNATEPVWISWENKIYEDRTIKNLKFFYEKYCCYKIK